MPIIILILLAMLVGTLGFWDAMGAVLGAVVLIGLFWVLVVLTVIAIGIWLIRKVF